MRRVVRPGSEVESYEAGSQGSWLCPGLSGWCTLLAKIEHEMKVKGENVSEALTATTKLFQACCRWRVVKLRRRWWQVPEMGKNRQVNIFV